MDAATFSSWLPGLTAAAAWGSLFGLIAVFARQRPAMEKLKQDKATGIRKDERTDLDDCKARLDRMSSRLDGVYEIVNNLKIELASVISAYRVLEVAEQARDPKSIHLAQSRAILSTAFTIAPSTHGGSGKSATLYAAEETQHQAEKTCDAANEAVDQVKRDESPKEGI